MKNENQIEVLNDLLKINNDRIEGYSKALENLKEDTGQLLPVFTGLKTESLNNKQELMDQVVKLGGSPADGTTLGGKIYRGWMDVKATFGGDDAKGILESCEGGEDAAKRAYESALESGNLEQPYVTIVQRQQETQRQSHDKIKQLRDEFKNK